MALDWTETAESISSYISFFGNLGNGSWTKCVDGFVGGDYTKVELSEAYAEHVVVSLVTNPKIEIEQIVHRALEAVQ